MQGYQYNEGKIIAKFFDTSNLDYIVEIGAADGEDNSNSLHLIWHGAEALLVEPHPTFYRKLIEKYANNGDVKLCHYAISNAIGWKNLYLNDQCSSVVYVNSHYISVQCTTLEDLFRLYAVPKNIDFLSVDVEGHDLEVLSSLNFKNYHVKLVCVEHSMGKEVLDQFMAERDYKLFDRTMGNSFYEKRSSKTI